MLHVAASPTSITKKALISSKVNDRIAVFKNRYKEQAIVRAKAKTTLYTRLVDGLSVLGTLALSTLPSIVKDPGTLATPFQKFLFGYYNIGLFVIFLAVFFTLSCKKYHYSNVHDTMIEQAHKRELSTAKSSKVTKQLKKNFENLRNFLGILCMQIASNNCDTKNYCDALGAAIMKRVEIDGGKYSVNIYEYNTLTKDIWMPSHLNNRGISDGPPLYDLPKGSKKVTDPDIANMYFCKCISKSAQLVNCLQDNDSIRKSFDFTGVDESIQGNYSQYINLVCSTNGTLKYMIEVVAFNGTVFAQPDELLQYVNETLQPYGSIIRLLGKISEQKA